MAGREDFARLAGHAFASQTYQPRSLFTVEDTPYDRPHPVEKYLRTLTFKCQPDDWVCPWEDDDWQDPTSVAARVIRAEQRGQWGWAAVRTIRYCDLATRRVFTFNGHDNGQPVWGGILVRAHVLASVLADVERRPGWDFRAVTALVKRLGTPALVDPLYVAMVHKRNDWARPAFLDLPAFTRTEEQLSDLCPSAPAYVNAYRKEQDRG
jgi:hypothetical protein